jgi:hypothetical protein
LRTGLTVPLEIYEVERARENGGLFVVEFRNLRQYKAMCFDIGPLQCAIAMPRATHWANPPGKHLIL